MSAWEKSSGSNRGLIANVSGLFWRILGYTEENKQQGTTSLFDMGAEENASLIRQLLKEYPYLQFPRIFVGSYARALEQASKLKRPLLVVIYSPEHSDTPVFMRRVLCDSAFRRFLDHRCVVWITSALEPDGTYLAQKLHATSFLPSFAVLVPGRIRNASLHPMEANMPPFVANVRFERGGVPPPLARAAISPRRAKDYYYRRDTHRANGSSGNEESKSSDILPNAFFGPAIPATELTHAQVEEMDEERTNAFPWVEVGLTAASLAQVPPDSADASSSASSGDASQHEGWLRERRVGRVFVDGLVSALRSLLDAYDQERRSAEAAAGSRTSQLPPDLRASPALAPLGRTDSVMNAQDAEFALAMQEDLERIRARRAAEEEERQRAQAEAQRLAQEQMVAAQQQCSEEIRELALHVRTSELPRRRELARQKVNQQSASREDSAAAAATSSSSTASGTTSNSNALASFGREITIAVKFPSGKRVSVNVDGAKATISDVMELVESSEPAVSELFMPPPQCHISSDRHDSVSHFEEVKERFVLSSSATSDQASAARRSWRSASRDLCFTAPYVLATAMPRTRISPLQLNEPAGRVFSNRTLLVVDVYPSPGDDDVKSNLADAIVANAETPLEVAQQQQLQQELDELIDPEFAKLVLLARAQLSKKRSDAQSE